MILALVSSFCIFASASTSTDSTANESEKAPNLPLEYLSIYLAINKGFRAEKNDPQTSLNDCNQVYAKLLKIHNQNPHWESVLVLGRLNDCRSKILELQAALGEPPNPPRPPDDWGKTALPSYPWRTPVSATLFWIGENSRASAWDANWQEHNNGKDVPGNRAGYFPGGHVSTLNPFYVALPFNDLTHREEAKKWLPNDWQKPSTGSRPVSACKDRWLEIKNANGNVCYAQWEDVGPRADNRADYIFGHAPAENSAAPGMCVSPAVSQYLALTGKDFVSWRFVDDRDVRPGRWLQYDEQALVFQALLQTNPK